MGSLYTKAQAKASLKYDEKFDIIRLRVPKGRKEIYKKAALNENKSLNQYILDKLDLAQNSD